MNSSSFDGTHREPADKTAAMVFSGGVKYHNPKAIVNPHWEICPQLRKKPKFCRNLKGKTVGRMTVVGYYKADPARWIVRCACGYFESRTARSILNPNNFGDRCAKCRQLAFEKKNYEFKKSGIQLDERTL